MVAPALKNKNTSPRTPSSSQDNSEYTLLRLVKYILNIKSCSLLFAELRLAPSCSDPASKGWAALPACTALGSSITLSFHHLRADTSPGQKEMGLTPKVVLPFPWELRSPVCDSRAERSKAPWTPELLPFQLRRTPSPSPGLPLLRQNQGELLSSWGKQAAAKYQHGRESRPVLWEVVTSFGEVSKLFARKRNSPVRCRSSFQGCRSSFQAGSCRQTLTHSHPVPTGALLKGSSAWLWAHQRSVAAPCCTEGWSVGVGHLATKARLGVFTATIQIKHWALFVQMISLLLPPLISHIAELELEVNKTAWEREKVLLLICLFNNTGFSKSSSRC